MAQVNTKPETRSLLVTTAYWLLTRIRSSAASITFTSMSTRPSRSSISSMRPCRVPTTRMREYTRRSSGLSSSRRSTKEWLPSESLPQTAASAGAGICSWPSDSSRKDSEGDREKLCGERTDGEELCSDTKDACSSASPSSVAASCSATRTCTAKGVVPMKVMASCTASDHLRAIQSRFHSSITPCSFPVNSSGIVSAHDGIAGSSSRCVDNACSADRSNCWRGSKQ